MTFAFLHSSSWRSFSAAMDAPEKFGILPLHGSGKMAIPERSISLQIFSLNCCFFKGMLIFLCNKK
jgi:hypothetical protein